MNEPRRLSKSGGVSQRLLDSASIDKPSSASRRRASALAATANTFASTQSGGSTSPIARRRPSTTKTLATWMLVGAAASGTLALLGSRLLDSRSAPDAASQSARGMTVLAEPETIPSAPARSPEIASEPPSPHHDAPPPPSPNAVKPPTPVAVGTIEPWVPSPVAPASVTSPTAAAPPRSVASFDEVQNIEAARIAVSNGDDTGALAKLNDYDHAHPNGELKPESMALRIQALSNSGKSTEARTLANDFQSRYPQHPLVQQVRRNVAK